MKKFALKSAILAISALAAASAFAAKNLDASVTANSYASELKIGSGIDLLDDGVLTDLNFSATHGVAPGAGVVTYIRIDLGNGATFKTAAPVLGTSGATGTFALSSGGADASFAIYALTPGATATAAADVITATINAAGITVLNKDAVTARIRVYETLTSAANPTASSALKDSGAKNLITFASGLTATITKGALVADVNPASGAAYTKFTPAPAAGSSLGKVVFAATADVAGITGAQVTLDAIIDEAAGTAASDVTFAGDFSFLKGASEAYGDSTVKARAFLHSLEACTGGTTTTVGSKTVSATSVAFTNIDAANLGTHFLCVAPEGSVAIPAGSYTVAVNYEPEAAYEVTDLAATAFGEITRNGTTLIAPMTNQPAGWYSRLVLTNSGASPRTYAVTAIAEDGTTVSLTGDAASGTVAASKTLVVNLQQLTSTVGLSRYGVQVVVNGPKSQISGAYQLVNSATGAIANSNLIEK